MISLDDHVNWCLSGGAIGSDLQWGMTAGKAGHGVVHWSFENHGSDAPKNEIVILTQDQLNEADPYCAKANESLHRKWPPKWLGTANLLRRNWFQVSFAESVYAISTFGVPGSQDIRTKAPYIHETVPIGEVFKGTVKGGTSWAVQMFIDRHNGEKCACYVFDQQTCYWFQWNGDGWLRLYEPPKPAGIWAGIGTRDLNQVGKLAIRTLMDYVPEKPKAP